MGNVDGLDLLISVIYNQCFSSENGVQFLI
jgi:hypothetical protein